jgi:hypothetical protein
MAMLRILVSARSIQKFEFAKEPCVYSGKGYNFPDLLGNAVGLTCISVLQFSMELAVRLIL